MNEPIYRGLLQSDLDCAGFDLLNFAGTEAANGIPSGGTAGQLLQKTSGTDFDADWATVSTGSSGSPRIVYASSVAELDSNVVSGGGTDDTVALQAALSGGNVVLVMDGAALISYKLLLESNTVIYCPDDSCGFFLKALSNEMMIENRNYNITNTVTDKNIALIGGTYNGNGTHQSPAFPGAAVYAASSGRLVSGIDLGAVYNVLIRDLKMLEHFEMNIHFCAVEKLRIYNAVFDAGGLPHGVNYGYNPSIQIQGPFKDIVIRDVDAINMGDDVIGLNADDDPIFTGHWSSGDASDILVDGLRLVGCRQGIRLLTSSHQMDRVTIRNVTGDAFGCAVQINNWINTDGPGHFGTITLENFDVRVSGAGYTLGSGGAGKPEMWCYINVDSPVTNLRISNFTQSDSFDARAAILFETSAVVSSCVLEGIVVPNATGTPIKVNGSVTFEPVHVGTDARLTPISGGVKLEVRNVSTGAWVEATRYTNP